MMFTKNDNQDSAKEFIIKVVGIAMAPQSI